MGTPYNTGRRHQKILTTPTGCRVYMPAPPFKFNYNARTVIVCKPAMKTRRQQANVGLCQYAAIAITSKFHLEGPGLPAYLIDRLVVTLASVRIACNHRFDANNTMQGEQNSRRSSMNSDGDDDLCPLMCYRL